ncbi:hypothetical protein J9303_20885 [Bacillaceae bacterium Marseille-Q3522]|nr:hypothetical protein [Bacillaceae bacterium Marseille-Q3522]
MEHFNRWNEVPSHLKTKTQLKELDLKPISELEYQATIIAKYNKRCSFYKLYDVNTACKPIKRRIVKEIEITDANIAESLYIINKSAKLSRDTKV